MGKNSKGPKIIYEPWRKKINIFADCETYIDCNRLNSELDDEDTLNALKYGTLIPWLVAFRVPKVVKNGNTYINTGIYETFISWNYPHKNFFEKMKELYKKGFTPVVWFHNAAYDLSAMFPTMFNDYDPNSKCFFYCKGKDKSFLHGGAEMSGLKIMFGDTLLYRKISLSAVGEMFGIPKGEIPYKMANLSISGGNVHYYDWGAKTFSFIPLKKCVDYVANDVYLLHRYYTQLNEERDLITEAINGENVPNIKNKTQATHSRALLDLYIYKTKNLAYADLFRYDITKEEYQIQKRSKKGGYCSRNKEIYSFICPTGWLIGSYDCNSMYPNIMLEGLPCGPLVEKKPAGEFIEWVIISTKKACWGKLMACCENVPIPIKLQNGNPFYITRDLLNFIYANMSEDSEIVEIATKYQSKTYIVGEFIKYLYNLRKEIEGNAKRLEEGREVSNAITSEINRLKVMGKGVKTTMNSLYGKFCEDSYLKISYRDKVGYYDYEDENAKYYNQLTGIYIADIGRLKIYEKIRLVIEAGFKFLYSDTDSVKFAYPTEKIDVVNTIFDEESEIIGDWCTEGVFHEYHNPGARKKYVFLNTDEPTKSNIALSGINGNLYFTGYENKLIYKPEEAFKELRYIFSKSKNVVFIEAKTRTIRTINTQQPIIAEVKAQTNPGLKKVSAECFIGEDLLPHLNYLDS